MQELLLVPLLFIQPFCVLRQVLLLLLLLLLLQLLLLLLQRMNDVCL